MYKVNSIPVYERIGSFLRGCKEVQKELLRVSWSPWHSRTTRPYCSCPTIGQVCPQQLWPNREAIGPLLATMPQYHIDDQTGNIPLLCPPMVGQVSYLTQEWQTNDRYGPSACLNVYFGVFYMSFLFQMFRLFRRGMRLKCLTIGQSPFFAAPLLVLTWCVLDTAIKSQRRQSQRPGRNKTK